MAYYTNLINAWNNVTQPPPGVTGSPLLGGDTTAQKIVKVNAWTVVGSVPTNFYTSGAALANCINWSEFQSLSATQQDHLLQLFQVPGNLQTGSAETALLVGGMITGYFPTAVTISSGTYNNSTGVVSLTVSGTVSFGVGVAINVASLTGTGAFASLEGIVTTTSPTSGSTVTYNAGAGLGASTITGGYFVPPTITALTMLAQGTVTPWWLANGYTSPIGTGDTTAAGLT